jgi:hypothetical protein
MGVISNVAPPNLPIAPQEYERRYQDQFSNVFNSVANKVNAPTPHASYYDTTTQTNPVANTVNLFTFNSVVSEFQVQRGIPTSKVYVADSGIYNFQFSVQLDKTGGTKNEIYIWPRVNGVNVPDSASKVVLQGTTDEFVSSWNFLLPLTGGDYFELAWQSPDTNVVARSEAAASNYPAIPSIILTVIFVSNYEASTT